MIGWLDKLKKRRVVHISVVIAYILLFMSMHVEFGTWLNGVFGGLSRDSYNKVILTIVLLVGLIFWVKSREDWKKLNKDVMLRGIGIYTLGAVLISYFFLMVINVEAVHFVQYAILAILIFPLLGSYLSVVIICAMVGALDEAYQYLYLDTRASYYDFNDIFLDTIGGGLGLLYLKIKNYSPIPKKVKWYARTEWLLGGVIVLVLTVMTVTGNFTVNMNQVEPAFFTLFKKPPDGFWTYPRGPYARFHILTPIPGLLSIVVSCYIYGLLDRVELIAE